MNEKVVGQAKKKFWILMSNACLKFFGQGMDTPWMHTSSVCTSLVWLDIVLTYFTLLIRIVGHVVDRPCMWTDL